MKIKLVRESLNEESIYPGYYSSTTGIRKEKSISEEPIIKPSTRNPYPDKPNFSEYIKIIQKEVYNKFPDINLEIYKEHIADAFENNDPINKIVKEIIDSEEELLGIDNVRSKQKVSKPTKDPRGYILYNILKFVNEAPRKNVEIRKFAYELKHGEGSWDPIRNRGWYSTSMQDHTSSYAGRMFQSHINTKNIRYYLTQLPDKTFILNDRGYDKLDELRNKFENK